MDLAGEQWLASHALIPCPHAEWMVEAGLDGNWGMYQAAYSRFCAFWRHYHRQRVGSSNVRPSEKNDTVNTVRQELRITLCSD